MDVLLNDCTNDPTAYFLKSPKSADRGLCLCPIGSDFNNENKQCLPSKYDSTKYGNGLSPVFTRNYEMGDKCRTGFNMFSMSNNPLYGDLDVCYKPVCEVGETFLFSNSPYTNTPMCGSNISPTQTTFVLPRIHYVKPSPPSPPPPSLGVELTDKQPDEEPVGSLVLATTDKTNRIANIVIIVVLCLAGVALVVVVFLAIRNSVKKSPAMSEIASAPPASSIAPASTVPAVAPSTSSTTSTS